MEYQWLPSTVWLDSSKQQNIQISKMSSFCVEQEKEEKKKKTRFVYRFGTNEQ